MRVYWSCSKFADWVRGSVSPQYFSIGDDSWEKAAKAAHPVRYWIAETALDAVQDFITWPVRKLYDIKYYINNRWVTKTHCLTAHPRDIPRGNWSDVGNRFLPCLFNELVDFVEVELAWWHIVWDDAKYKEFNAPWYSRGWFRWRTWRSPACGLANLEWQRNLVWGDDEFLDKDDERYGKPTYQAVKAQEILDLYTWWTVIRPARPDPYEASGWMAACERARELNGGKLSFSTPPGLKKERDRAHKLLTKMEATYEAEDEAMMIRLIKVRNGLWT